MLKNHLDGCTTDQVAYFVPHVGHIGNPGMGIVAMAVSDNMATSTTKLMNNTDFLHKLRPDRAMIDNLLDDELCDVVYVRVGWRDVQRESGKLEFSPQLEMILDEIKRKGKRWAFRLMQNSSGNYPSDLIPEYIRDKLPKVEISNVHYPVYLPLYTDEYLKHWGETLLLLGERFDSDPDFEYADISGFGLWGEGHHYFEYNGVHKNHVFGSWERYEYAVDELIKSHYAAFPSTPAVMTLHLCDYSAGRKALNDGAWVRRDSFSEYYRAYESLYAQSRKNNAALLFEADVPPGCYCVPDKQYPNRAIDTVKIAAMKIDQGTAYSAVGFNPVDFAWMRENIPEMFDNYSARLGYRIRPSVVWRCEYPDGRRSLALDICNDGCATPPGKVTFKLDAGKDSAVTVDGNELGMGVKMIEIPLPSEPWRTYKLTAEITLGKKTKPIRFATDCDDGIAPYEITVNTVL